jgi:hypothetical protein
LATVSRREVEFREVKQSQTGSKLWMTKDADLWLLVVYMDHSILLLGCKVTLARNNKRLTCLAVLDAAFHLMKPLLDFD